MQRGQRRSGRAFVAEVSPRLVVGDAPLLADMPGSGSRIALAELRRLLPPEPLFTVSQAVVESAPFQIAFTSGTTSEPKGVVHTHRNVLASLRPIEAEIGRYRRYERWFHPLRFLHTLPFSHVFGQFMGVWIPGLLGAEVHLPERIEPGRLIRIARGERVSVLVAVPRVLDLLRGSPRRPVSCALRAVGPQRRHPSLETLVAVSGGACGVWVQVLGVRLWRRHAAACA